MNPINYQNRTISAASTLLEALKKMDEIDKKLLLVFDDLKFEGLVSAGDIQRAIIQNKSLQIPVKEIIRHNIKVAKSDDSFDDIKNMMINFRMELCPVVNNDNEIVALYFWEDIFEKNKPHHFQQIELPVVIMAGGFGTRLKPLTNVLPKPLIPIGDHTMIEEIINRFSVYGCNDFHISVNYKADLIAYYINSLKLNQNISFFKETKPQGTAGSLSLLKGKIDKTFFVSNCDILINQDYSEILDFHRQNKNELTIVAALKNYAIPYGTLETGENGELIGLKEKPDFSILVNTGMYILEPNLIDEIPNETFFHITHLIEKLKAENRKVGVFPVSEGSWYDTGEWDEYNKTQEKISKSNQ
jgi:dTDP-glucose pyrophosphorylase